MKFSCLRQQYTQTFVHCISFDFFKNKLEHGERIRGNLFNYHWSRRELLGVPLSWRGLVSIPL